MSATPIAADHSEEFEQLAGLSALRVLDGDDQERFERHAAQCEQCRLIVRLDRETLGNLSLAAAEMEPSADFKRRLMDRAAAELAGQAPASTAPAGQAPVGQASAGQAPVGHASADQAPAGQAPPGAASADISSIETAPTEPPRTGDTASQTPITPAQPESQPPAELETRTRAEPESPLETEPETTAEPIPLRPRPGNVVPFWRRQPWATSIAALLVLGIFSYAAYTAFMNQVVATYTTGSGPASMTVTVHRSGQTELQLQGVADPPPGFVYEAWVIPPGKAPVAAGVTPTGDATLPLPSGVQGTIAVTLERGPSGASAPTSAPLMAVVVA